MFYTNPKTAANMICVREFTLNPSVSIRHPCIISCISIIGTECTFFSCSPVSSEIYLCKIKSEIRSKFRCMPYLMIHLHKKSRNKFTICKNPEQINICEPVHSSSAHQ